MDSIKQEIDQEKDLDRIDDKSGDINPYIELTVDNAEKEGTALLQMGQWSILSNIINYTQYDKYQRNFHNLDIKAINHTKQ